MRRLQPGVGEVGGELGVALDRVGRFRVGGDGLAGELTAEADVVLARDREELLELLGLSPRGDDLVGGGGDDGGGGGGGVFFFFFFLEGGEKRE